ncbi:MAG: hypothetical protein C5B59_15930 [Bacteroidetes bacterium]|nr:MAG: hypothetical protein C5B59_15930 [Bacteroidota bacterium]
MYINYFRFIALAKSIFTSNWKCLLIFLLVMVSVPIANARELDSISMTSRLFAIKNQHFVKAYLLKNKRNLTEIKKKSAQPFHLIDAIFKAEGVPIQLRYLVVVESELNTRAVSRVGAAGPWQLMPATAKLLGLKITAHRDDRMNFSKSTMAAARHLKGLHEKYANWLLVVAAYNCGDQSVLDAIKDSGSCNYSVLEKYLPTETREYVAKYIATSNFFEGSCRLAVF